MVLSGLLMLLLFFELLNIYWTIHGCGPTCLWSADQEGLFEVRSSGGVIYEKQKGRTYVCKPSL